MIPYRLLGGAALVIAVGSGGVYLGYQWAYGVAASERESAIRRAIAQEQARQAQDQEIVDAWAAEASEKRIVYRTITREVIKHVQTVPERQCLDDSALRLLNAAGSGDSADLSASSGAGLPGSVTEGAGRDEPRDSAHRR